MQPNQMRLLVTGATGGLGRAVTSLLAAQGCSLFLVGRNEESLAELLHELPPPETGQEYQALAMDITDSKARQALVDSLQQAGLNGLINLAGTNQFCLLEKQAEATIESMIQTNLTATLQLTRQLLPLLQQQPEALIMNVGSTLGSIGYPGYAVYCASKFALRGFSEALSRELADTSVRVLYFAPRAVDTQLNCDASVAMNRKLGNAVDSPEQVAAELVKALQSGRVQTFIGWPEKLFVRVNSLLPGLVSRNLDKQLPVIKKFL